MRNYFLILGLFSLSLSSAFAQVDQCAPNCTGTLPSIPNPQHEILDNYLINARADRKNRPEIIYQVTATVSHSWDKNKDQGVAHATRTINRDGSITWGPVTWENPNTSGLIKFEFKKFVDGEQSSSADARDAVKKNNDPTGALNYCNYDFVVDGTIPDTGPTTAVKFKVTAKSAVVNNPSNPHPDRFVNEEIIIDKATYREIAAKGQAARPTSPLVEATFDRTFTLQGNLRLDQHAFLHSNVKLNLAEKLLASTTVGHADGVYDIDLQYSSPKITP